MGISAMPMINIDAQKTKSISQHVAQPGKVARKMARKMKSEGWNPIGGLPIDAVLQKHYDLLAAEGSSAVSLEGYAEARQLNAAIRMAQNNAIIQYAQMMGTQIDGRTLTEISSISTNETKSATKYDATFISKVQQMVKAVKPTMAFYHQKNDGVYVVRAFYIGKSVE